MLRSRSRKMTQPTLRALLDAARVEFARHGADASLNAILDACEISKGAFYYYFDNKNELFEAVVLDTVAPMLAAAKPPSPRVGIERTPRDPEAFWADVERYFDAVNDSFRADPEAAAILRVAANLMADARWAQTFHEMRRAAMPVVERVIEEGQRMGAVRQDLTPDLIALLVFSATERLDQYALQNWEHLDQDQIERLRLVGVDLMRRIARPPLDVER